MRDTDDLPVPTAHSNLHHGRRDRKDEYEDMNIPVKEMATLREYCIEHDGCKDCPLEHSHDNHKHNECKLMLEPPSFWGDIVPEIDDYYAMSAVAEDIQHVGYTPEACGYEK